MRYTVIDANGVISFVGKCEVLPSLVAGCANDAGTLADLLAATTKVDPNLSEQVACGLAVFDEHNSQDNYEAIHGAIAYMRPHELPVFRVVDDVTRQASLQPVKAGVIVFNLPKRRIVQILNTYVEIRTMVGNVKRLERTGWRIVP